MNGLMTLLYYLSRILLAVMIGIGALVVFLVTVAAANMGGMAGSRSINRGPYW